MGSSAGLFSLIGGATTGAASIANGYTQSRAYGLQGDYARRMGNVNASLSDIQAQDALRRGDLEANRLGIRTRQLIGEQRVSAAGQGVEVNSGSPLNLQTDTAALSMLDQSTIRNNAYKEAMGLRMEAATERARGNMAYRTGRFQASNSLLSGGLNALGSVGGGLYNYYRYTPPMTVPAQGEYFPPRPG